MCNVTSFSNMRLYFASSLFSIISIMQIQLSERKNAILILENEIPNAPFLKEKIKDLNLFSDVIVLNVKNRGSLKYYLRNRAPEGTSFWESVKQSCDNLYHWILKTFSYDNYLFHFLPKNIADTISEFYISSAAIPCIALADYLLKTKKISDINLVEESVREYITDSYINKVRNLMKTKNVHFNLHMNLPKISVLQTKKEELNISIYQVNKESVNLLEKIACVFAENKSYKENEFIYFDQMTVDVTRYASWGKLKKFLLKNSLKKATSEIKHYPKRIYLIKKLIEFTNKYNLIFKIRLHPRCLTYNNFGGVDKKYFYSRIEDKTNVPWEFILLSNKNKRCNLLSLCSTSVVSGLLLYGNKFSGTIIFLYKITQENVPNLWIFESLQQEYPNKIYIPKDIDELESILKENKNLA